MFIIQLIFNYWTSSPFLPFVWESSYQTKFTLYIYIYIYIILYIYICICYCICYIKEFWQCNCIKFWVTLILLFLFVVCANVIVYKLACANVCIELKFEFSKNFSKTPPHFMSGFALGSGFAHDAHRSPSYAGCFFSVLIHRCRYNYYKSAHCNCD